MTIALSLYARNLRCQAMRAAIDNDADPAEIHLYSGTRPSPGGTPSGALQAVLVLEKPSCTVAGAMLSWVVPVEGQRINNLDIAWARVVDGAGAWQLDGSISLIGAGGDFEIDQVGGNIGAFVRLSGGGLIEP